MLPEGWQIINLTDEPQVILFSNYIRSYRCQTLVIWNLAVCSDRGDSFTVTIVLIIMSVQWINVWLFTGIGIMVMVLWCFLFFFTIIWLWCGFQEMLTCCHKSEPVLWGPKVFCTFDFSWRWAEDVLSTSQAYIFDWGCSVKISSVLCFCFQLSMNCQQYQERKTKLEENLAHVGIQFRKLHIIHDKVLEISSQTEDPTPQVAFIFIMFLYFYLLTFTVHSCSSKTS